MTRVETSSDLKRAWRAILRRFGRDLALTAKLAHDPVAAMHDMGFDLSPEAATALTRALP